MTTEREVLSASLRAVRRHVLGAIDGVGDEDLRRPVLPTGWSCLGLIRHLTVDIEGFWFRGVVAGEPVVTDAPPVDGWRDLERRTSAEIVADYRREIERSDTIIAATELDAAPAWWPGDLFGEWRLDDLREILLHVIIETATHAGHLDAARELIDGRTWFVTA